MILPYAPGENDRIETWDSTAFADQFTQLGSSKYVFVNVTKPAGGGQYTAPNPPLVAAVPELAPYFPTRDILGETLDLIQASGREAIVYLGCIGFEETDEVSALWLDYIKSDLGSGKKDEDGIKEYIIKYYAQRYGDKIDGWWFDGSNRFYEELKQEVKDAIRSGNPNALVTYGTHPLDDYFGGHPTIRAIADHWSYDYNYRTITDTEAGPFTEVVDGVSRSHHYPVEDPADGSLKHIFSGMQENWTRGDLKFPAWQAVDWCSRVVEAGGMFSWSIPRDFGFNKMLDPQFQLTRMCDVAIGGAKFLHDSFETDFGAWIDGGADCSYYTGSYGSHGEDAIELTGNSSSSFMSTADLPMSGSSLALFRVEFYTTGMGGGDSFELQISTNGGSSYSTVKTWTYSTDFENDEYAKDVAFLEGYEFNDQTRFRFRSYAGGASVYIDNVKMNAITTNPPPPLPVDHKPVFIVDPIIKYLRGEAAEGRAYEDKVRAPLITGCAVDADGDTLTYSKVDGPAWLTIATNGYLSGTPLTADVGTNVFTVLADDGTGNTTTAKLILPVVGNGAPVWSQDPLHTETLLAGDSVSNDVSGYASEPDSEPMTFSKASGPAWLSVSTNGIVSGTCGEGDAGLNVLMVKAEDSYGLSATAAVHYTVFGTPDYLYEAENAVYVGPSFDDTATGYTGTGYLNPNNNTGDTIEWTVDAPVAGDYAIAFRYSLFDSKNGRPLEIQLNGQVIDPLLAFPETGGWDIWVYTAALDVTLNEGTNTVRATTTGSEGANLDHLAVWSQVTGAPYFTSDPINEINADIDVAYSSSIADDATDPESDPMTFSKVSGPDWLNVSTNGVLSGTPAGTNLGVNAFTVQVDAADGSDTATLNIRVVDPTAPSFTTDPINEISATEDAVYSASLADDASDPESDPMTFSKVDGPDWLAVASDGTLSGTPGVGDLGANVFTVQVADDNGGTETATLNITVISKYAALIANFDFQNYAKNSLGNDPTATTGDAKDRVYSNNTADVTGVASVSDIAFTVATINTAQNKTELNGAVDNIAYRTDFDGPLEDPITATFVVTLDAGYTLSDYSVGFTENNNNEKVSTYLITANGTEIGSGTLTGDDSVYNTGTVAGPLTNTITFVVALTPGDDSTATLRVDDFTLNGLVIPVTGPPTFTTDPINEINAAEGVAYSSTIADDASDPDSDPMTFSKVDGPAWLIVGTDGSLSGIPSSTNVGANVFTVQVDDGNGGTDTATLNITVFSSNPADVYIVVDPSKTGYAAERDSLITFLNDHFPGQLGTITSDAYLTNAPAAGAGDLVIFGRATGSGQYDESVAEIESWNNSAAGILMLTSYPTESDRFGWSTSTAGGTAVATGSETTVTADDLFNGVTITNGHADLLAVDTRTQPATAYARDGQMVVGTAPDGTAILVRIDKGTAWATTATTSDPSGTHGGARIVFYASEPTADAGYNGLYADLTADGQIVLENAIAELLSAIIAEPVRIESSMTLVDQVMKLEVSGASPSAAFCPASTTNLVEGTWGRIPHSDDGVNPFIVTNFNYSTTDGTNRFIYLQQSTNNTEFIRIQGVY